MDSKIFAALAAGSILVLCSSRGQQPADKAPPPNVDSGGVAVHAADGKVRMIRLDPDDTQAFPTPPRGFDVADKGIEHGRLDFFFYDSKTVGTRRRALVYTPPGFGSGRRYPVLYLLHGIGGEETEWQRFTSPEIVLDNLIHAGGAVPMIVVMPNGRASRDDRPPAKLFTPEQSAAFANFLGDLMNDLIPAVEARYPAEAGREHRALAGLSMGGGQSLNFGLTHLDSFAWIGAFSPAPNTRPPAELLPDPADATRRLKLLWISCGNRDDLLGIAQGVHRYLKANHVPHVWNVDGNAHDATEWKNNFYYFSQRVFR